MEVRKTEETKGIDCLQVYLQTCLLNRFPGRARLLQERSESGRYGSTVKTKEVEFFSKK